MTLKIELHGVEKVYQTAQGEVDALSDINLSVEEGEFLMHHRPFWVWEIDSPANISGFVPAEYRRSGDSHERSKFSPNQRSRISGICHLPLANSLGQCNFWS